MKITGIPKIGLGTFGSDHVDPEDVARAVYHALQTGYRHIDCASVYGNEVQIGAVLRRAFDEGIVSREEVWITSKLWNDMHGTGDVTASCRKTLRDLQLEYLDLYLVHWPVPNFHPAKCDVNSRSPGARPFVLDKYMKTWREMETLVDAGLVRCIGTSNMTVSKLSGVLEQARIKPYVNELELHPAFQQKELLSYVKDNGIIPVAYCPLGSPGRPERDKTPDDAVDMEDPVVVELAKKYGVHPAAICLKWEAGCGAVPIPFSTNPRNIDSNFKAVMENPLSEEDMNKMASADRNSRLIKGQVFLWEGASDWRDLWK